MSPDTGLHEILARGFPWKVKPADVRAFFPDVNIFGGAKGINIIKKNAMEATFYVNSKDEVRKAIARDGKQIDGRVIHGNFTEIF